MNYHDSNAVKALNKRSARVCIIYLLIFGGIGLLLIAYSTNSLLLEDFTVKSLVILISAFCFIIAAAFFVKMLIKKDFGPHIKGYFNAHPETTIMEIDKDFAEAENIKKNLWIGNKCTYHIGYLYPYIRENKEIVWVYLTHISGRGGGWQVNFCDINKQMTSFTIKSEKIAKRIEEIYRHKFNHIVIGYNEDLEKMYNEDIDRFLDLKYNLSFR